MPPLSGHWVLFFALVTVMLLASWCYRSPARLNSPAFVAGGALLLAGMALFSAGFRVPAGLVVGGAIVALLLAPVFPARKSVPKQRVPVLVSHALIPAVSVISTIAWFRGLPQPVSMIVGVVALVTIPQAVGVAVSAWARRSYEQEDRAAAARREQDQA